MALSNKTHARGLGNTYGDVLSITPNDTTDLAEYIEAWMVGANGTIKIDLWRGATVTLTVVAGTVYPIGIKRVYATGTTATGIVGLKK